MSDTAEHSVAETPPNPAAIPAGELARMTDDIVAALKTVYDPEIPVDIYELGLIYKVCPAAELDATALGLATQLATQPTYALALIKQLLAASSHNSLEQQLEMEAEYQGLAGRSDDYAEGVTAFLAKRTPSFTGK